MPKYGYDDDEALWEQTIHTGGYKGVEPGLNTMVNALDHQSYNSGVFRSMSHILEECFSMNGIKNTNDILW